MRHCWAFLTGVSSRHASEGFACQGVASIGVFLNPKPKPLNPKPSSIWDVEVSGLWIAGVKMASSGCVLGFRV